MSENKYDLKEGEALDIGDGIVITLVKLKTLNASIGVQVEGSKTIYREEIHAKIKKENSITANPR